MAARIAIADADDPPTRDFKVHQISGGRNGAPLCVAGGDRKHGHIGAVGVNDRAVGREHKLRGRAGRLDAGGCDRRAAAIAAGLEHARRVGDLPLEVAVARHVFFPERDAIQEQLDGLVIAEADDGELLTLPPRPVPVRVQVEHGLIGPPGFDVIGGVLRESTRVEETEMRDDPGPAGRPRLAAKIEPGPEEQAREEGPCRVVIPALFGVAAGVALQLR